jgi:hypothetical protein
VPAPVLRIAPGDPTIWGWLAVAAYAAAALGCAGAAVRGPAGRRRERLFWAAAAVAMLALGVNKQLDLQRDLGRIVREAAWGGGWYDQRRAFQAWFIESSSLAGLAAAAALLVAYRRAPWPHWIAILGTVGLIAYVVVRAASFHYVDVLLVQRAGSLRLSTALELLGTAFVAAGAGAAWWRSTRQPSRSPTR